jgi:hypothetical protein
MSMEDLDFDNVGHRDLVGGTPTHPPPSRLPIGDEQGEVVALMVHLGDRRGSAGPQAGPPHPRRHLKGS